MSEKTQVISANDGFFRNELIAGAVSYPTSTGNVGDLLVMGASGAAAFSQPAGVIHSSTEILAATGAVALSVETAISNVIPSAPQTGTLAAGTVIGQRKIVLHASGATTFQLTPTNFANGTTITTNAVGEAYELVWNGFNWYLLSLGSNLGALGPTVA